MTVVARMALVAPEATEDELKFRLDAGGFVLERGETSWGVGYRVVNAMGFVVFGNVPHPYSATLDQVRAFAIAQEL